MQEREEISRGLAGGASLRAIAVRIGRSPATVCREVARNHGRQSYRAGSAEEAALSRGQRPKPAKLKIYGPLRMEVMAPLRANWSPQQISRCPKAEYPAPPERRISPHTTYHP